MRSTRHLSVSAMMDPGLSRRARSALDGLGPALEGTAPETFDPFGNTIDLSCGGNEVLYPELQKFLGDVVRDVGAVEAFTSPTESLNGGDLGLRNALAGFFNSYFKPVHAVRAEHIVLTAGTTDAIENVIHAVCDDGDSVLVPGPSCPTLSLLLKRKANVTPIAVIPPTHIHWDNYLVPSLQAAYDFSDYRTRIKAVLLSNPNNPLSRCYPRETLRELLEFCQERGLHLIVDEGAGLMALDEKEGGGVAKKKRNGETFVSALSLTEPLVPEGAVKVDPSRVHVVWDASRLFGLGGLKIGCVVSQQNTPLLSSLALTATHPSSLSTIYLTSLLTSSLLPSLLTLNTSRLSTSYNMLASFLRRHDIEIVVPTHGPFLAAKLAKKTRTSEEENAFWRELEGRGGIKVAPGRAFNGVEKDGGWARVNFAVREEVMQEVVGKLQEFFGESG